MKSWCLKLSILQILDFIMPLIKKKDLLHNSINTSYQRFKPYIMSNLNIPDLPRKGKWLLVQRVLRSFIIWSQNIVKTLDAILVNFDFTEKYSDLDDIKVLTAPNSSTDIEVAFDRRGSVARSDHQSYWLRFLCKSTVWVVPISKTIDWSKCKHKSKRHRIGYGEIISKF